MRTFPATSGGLSGWLGIAGAALIVFLVVAPGDGLSGAPTLLGAVLFAVLTYAYLLRPQIRTEDQDIVLVNPLMTIRIPLVLVSEVRVRSATNVFVGPKRYVGVAVGRKLRQMARPRSEGAGAVGPMGMGLGRAEQFASEQAGYSEDKASIADLLESWSIGAIALARTDQHLHEGEPVVRREPVWWLIATVAVLAVATVVSLVV